MKNSHKLLALVLAAAAAGVALFAAANSSFSASLRGDVFVGVTTAVALIGFTVKDYSRRVTPLTPPARLLRPSLPVKTSASRNFARLAA